MDEVFASRHHRRIFIAATALTFFALAVLRYYLTPASDAKITVLATTTIAIVDNIISGLFASILLGATLYYFRPKGGPAGLMSQLEPRNIIPAFEQALVESSGWIFRGNRGRYLRSKILPYLASKQGTFVIEAILMNPSNLEACKRFADHKRVTLTKDEPGTWDYERVQAEILAAMTVSAWYARIPSLTITVHLNNSFSPIRFDSNRHVSFLTVEDTRESCLMFRRGNFFHEWLQDDFAIAKLQAKQVQLPAIDKASLAAITSDDVERIARAVGIQNPAASVLTKTTEIVRANVDPFR